MRSDLILRANVWREIETEAYLDSSRFTIRSDIKVKVAV